jgi:hypothetical protein
VKHQAGVEPGKIVRVTTCWTETGGDGFQTITAPSWGVTKDTPHRGWEGSSNYAYVEWLELYVDEEWSDEWNDSMIEALHIGYDEFEVIPDDQVPDHVWAKLAELRLRGE